MMLDNFLESNNACNLAKMWAQGKTFQEAYNDCERGDWMLWVFAKTNPDDFQKLTLVKGLCANLLRPFISNKDVLFLIDSAIAFGKGEGNIKILLFCDHIVRRIDRPAIEQDEDYFAAGAAISAVYHYDNIFRTGQAAAAAANVYDFIAIKTEKELRTLCCHDTYTDLKIDEEVNKYKKLTADICKQNLPFELWNLKQ